MIVLYLALGLIALFFLLTLLCWRLAFGRGPEGDFRRLLEKEGTDFYTYRQEILAGLDYYATLEGRDLWLTSRDGLRLHARHIQAEDERCLVLLFHGYRSRVMNDFSCAIRPYLGSGCSLLLIDQRAAGDSQGRSMTFGIRERWDCRDWAWLAAETFPGVPLLLDGMSMGAATVLMASSLDLPPAVKGILADSGYTSPAAIIKKVIRQIHLPLWPVYPLVRWGGRLYGGFDIESCSAEEELRKCALPLLLVHGEADDFVPCAMGRANYAACAGPARLVTVAGADHGFGFLADKPRVQGAIDELLEQVCS